MWVKIAYFLQALFIKNDKRCPYCHRADYEVVAKKYKLVDICFCKKCSLYWTNPIFRFPYFYNFFYNFSNNKVSNSGEREIKQLLESNFKNSGRDYKLLLVKLRKIVFGNKILEFGSSWGYFLWQARKLGFDVTGVEISVRCREIGKKLGLTILPDLDGLVKKNKKFNLIFTSHVLEHVGSEINLVFDKFYKLLENNGLLFIEVPNLLHKNNHIDSKLMGAFHPLGFSKEFFLKNLSQKGFSKIKIFVGYNKLLKNYQNDNSSLIIMARKSKKTI